LRRIEALTVCVNYADFLEVTIRRLRNAVDDLVVVTEPDDMRTRHVAKQAGVRTCITTAMYDADRKFSLGAAINAGLKSLKQDAWVLVVDADIMLPANTRDIIGYVPLLPSGIHGIDRVHCRGRAAWDKFATTTRPVREWNVSYLRDFPVGSRITVPTRITGDGDGTLGVKWTAGYVPSGFWQLWNPIQSKIPDYPIDERGTAEGSDILHALRWPRMSRNLIPDLVAIELGTDKPTEVGANWAGRTTPEFSREGGPYRR
jgi:hypothetical protein